MTTITRQIDFHIIDVFIMLVKIITNTA